MSDLSESMPGTRISSRRRGGLGRSSSTVICVHGAFSQKKDISRSRDEKHCQICLISHSWYALHAVSWKVAESII